MRSVKPTHLPLVIEFDFVEVRDELKELVGNTGGDLSFKLYNLILDYLRDNGEDV